MRFSGQMDRGWQQLGVTLPSTRWSDDSHNLSSASQTAINARCQHDSSAEHNDAQLKVTVYSHIVSSNHVTHPAESEKLSETFNARWPFRCRHESLSRKDFQEVANPTGAFYDSVLTFNVWGIFQQTPYRQTVLFHLQRTIDSILSLWNQTTLQKYQHFTSRSRDAQKSHFRETNAFSHTLFMLWFHSTNKKSLFYLFPKFHKYIAGKNGYMGRKSGD